MNIVSAFVLFAVVWFMMLFVILPLRLQSQGEADDVVDGTSPSAPVDPMIGKKVKWITLLTIPIWALISGVIISGVITIDMFDIYNGIEN